LKRAKGKGCPSLEVDHKIGTGIRHRGWLRAQARKGL